MSKRIVVFNHKGGVSKTTSVYNLGWMLSKSFRVLIVDGDPQCNLSSLMLGDDFEPYYFNNTTKFHNIKDGVAAAFSGKPEPIGVIQCPTPERAPNLHLLAGHANLSEYEASLTFAQTTNNAISTLQNLPGAFAELLSLCESQYSIDYTIIDLNPSLSAINQNLFLISQAFILPTNPDPFSLMAIDTLEMVLPRWTEWKNQAEIVFRESAYQLPPGTPKFVGTLIQRFNIRKGKAARPYRNNIEEIKQKTKQELFGVFSRNCLTFDADVYPLSIVEEGFCLAEIPDFQGLLPKSYDAGVPIFELTDAELGETGPVLDGLREKRKVFYSLFVNVCDSITSIVNNV